MTKPNKLSKRALMRILVNSVVICILAIAFTIGHGDSSLWPLILAGIIFEFFAVLACEFIRVRHALPLLGVAYMVWAVLLFCAPNVIRLGFQAWIICLGLLTLGVIMLSTFVRLIKQQYGGPEYHKRR